MSKIGFFVSSVGFIYLMTCLAFLVVVGFWVVMVCRSSGNRRKSLLAAGLTVIGLAVVLIGGHGLLGIFELTWRQWLKTILALLLWCGGVAVSVLIVCWNSAAFSKCGRVLRRWGQVLVGLCLVISMGLGTLFGGVWLYGGEESVTEWNGKKIVMEEEHFLDYHCAYYEYRGPFVRGSKAIGPLGG